MGSAWIHRRVKTADGRWLWDNSRTIAAPSDVRFYVRYRLHGRGSRVRTDGVFRTERDARVRLRVTLTELAAKRDPARRRTESGRQTLEQAVTSYRERMRSKRSHDTVTNYGKALQALGSLASIPCDELSFEEVQTWIDRRTTRVSSSKVHFGIYRQAFAWTGITPNPFRDSRLQWRREGRRETRPPNWEQIRAIEDFLATGPKRESSAAIRGAIMVLDRTGIRPRELKRLRGRDFDLGQRRIAISEDAAKPDTVGQRSVPITSDLVPILRDLGIDEWDDDEIPFARLRSESVTKAMRRACDHLGYTERGLRFTARDLRHRYISRLRMASVPTPVIRLIVGHSDDTQIDRVYSHILLKEPAGELERLRREVMDDFARRR